MSEPAPISCRWDRCTEVFPSRDQLLLHITEEHIKPMKPMLKDEIIIMKKLDKARLEFETDMAAGGSDNIELSTQSESAMSIDVPSMPKPRSARQPSSPADNLATIQRPLDFGSDSRSRIWEIRGKTGHFGTHSRGSSQDVVERQLTQEDSSEHAVNGNRQPTSINAPGTQF
ncbi:hypothetical protein J3A83DRAFT_4225111 [Scleroderma citrinum]